MKKCPYCAEEIKDEAIKCKHCKSNLSEKDKNSQNQKEKSEEFDPNSTENTKKLLKWIGIGISVILGIWLAIKFWYLSIPGAIVVYIWRKTDWRTKKKLIGTGGAVVLMGALIGLNAYINRTPSLNITSPANNTTLQSNKVTIKGSVSPNDSDLSIDGKSVSVEDGAFEKAVDIPKESNSISITASNGDNSTTTSITVNRKFVQPSLEITSPKSGITLQNNKTTIKGTVSPDYAKLKANGESISAKDGNFSHQVDLPNTTNRIQVIASDGDKSASTTLIVNREFVQPTISIEKPESGTTTTKDQIELSGQLSPHYADLKIDGQSVDIDSNGQFSYTKDLDVGRHSITVKASDGSKTASRNIIVTRKLTQQEKAERRKQRRAEYFAKLAPIYSSIADASSELGRIFQSQPNPYSWSQDQMITVAGNLGTFKAQYNSIQDISPPRNWKSYHRQTVDMLRKYNRMADLMAEGIDNMNVSKMRRAVELQRQVTNQMQDLISQLREKTGQTLEDMM